MDIVYAAGDKAEFKPVLIPYHGMHIFENDGNNGFEELYFEPLNGAYGAKIADFDQDGNLDMAAISFFPDYTKAAIKSFVHFDNQGDFKFRSAIFANNTRGPWTVMDIADLGNEGDMDVLLGSLTFEMIPDNGYVQR